MGGDHKEVHATIVAVPGGYYGVGIINSSDFDSGGVTARIVRAFKTGLGMPEDPMRASYPQQLQQAETYVVAMTTVYEKALASGFEIAIYFAKGKLAAAQLKLAEVKPAGERAACSM